VSDVDRARRVLLKRMRYMARRLTKPRIVRIGRVLLEVDDSAVSPAMRDEIYSERYESRELRLLGDLVKPSDNVMEIGAGLGYLASWYGRVAPRILLVEANPYLIPLIRRNLRANGVAAEVVHGVLGPSNGKRTLHLSADFWDASLIPTDKHTASVEIDQLDAGEMFSRFSPTFLIIDIEGGEAELLPWSRSRPYTRSSSSSTRRWSDQRRLRNSSGWSSTGAFCSTPACAATKYSFFIARRPSNTPSASRRRDVVLAVRLQTTRDAHRLGRMHEVLEKSRKVGQ